MSDVENEIKVLKEQNNELVQKVQYWKMTAAQRENEKLELLKEMNELRLKLSRLRSGGAAQVRQLHAALQVASKDAIDHLVQASNAITQSMDAANAYMRERQELDASSPRWSSLSGTPTSERVNRVPPLLIGGQSIQPVVSLSRTLLNGTTTRIVNRSPNQNNRNITERAVPIHMLQDVYIPLTRIDAGEVLSNMEREAGSNSLDDSADNLGLDGSEEVIEDSQNNSDIDNYENSIRLNAVNEDSEPDEDEQTPLPIPRPPSDNPLEGPSWLLDVQSVQPRRPRPRVTLEPDSTTELEEAARVTTPVVVVSRLAVPNVGCEFSPTVRRRKRTSTPPPPPAATPPYSPRTSCSMSGRVLKVMVAKMKLEEDVQGGGDVSPPKRANVTTQRPTLSHSPVQDAGNHTPVPEGSPREPRRRDRSPKRMMRFDAPSPNGATDARVIVSEAKDVACGSGDGNDCVTSATERETRDTRDTRDTCGSRVSRCDSDASRDARDSDSSTERGDEGRTRRARKQITYKEKPLNRKMRR